VPRQQVALHDADGGLQHPLEGAQIVHARDRPVTGDQRAVRGQPGHERVHVAHVAEHVAAAVQVDEGEAPGEEVVAQVRHVAGREPHDAVAVGVPGGQVDHADLLAVPVQPDRLAEGDHRQRFGRGGLLSPPQHLARAQRRAGRSRARRSCRPSEAALPPCGIMEYVLSTTAGRPPASSAARILPASANWSSTAGRPPAET
jgi:hypothetical protein